MNNELFQQALENISEPMIEEAAQIYQCAEYKHRKKRKILRIAAIAAVLAILMTALLFLDGVKSHTPYFSVYLYANGADGIELTVDQNSAICNFDRSDDPTYRPIFDSQVTPGDSANPYKGWFHIKIRLDNRTKDYTNLSVLVDNKEIDQFTSGTVFLGYTSSHEEGRTGFSLLGNVEKPTKIDLILYDDFSNVLQSYTVRVTPIDDGYKIVLEEAYVTADGKNVFSRFG